MTYIVYKEQSLKNEVKVTEVTRFTKYLDMWIHILDLEERSKNVRYRIVEDTDEHYVEYYR